MTSGCADVCLRWAGDPQPEFYVRFYKLTTYSTFIHIIHEMYKKPLMTCVRLIALPKPTQEFRVFIIHHNVVLSRGVQCTFNSKQEQKRLMTCIRLIALPIQLKNLEFSS